MNSHTLIIQVTCKDCQGTGRNGTLDGADLTCRLCWGRGTTLEPIRSIA